MAIESVNERKGQRRWEKFAEGVKKATKTQNGNANVLRCRFD
jgi:hypothetical protein